MLTLPTTIHKTDITPTGSQIGKSNSAPFSLNGTTYSKNQLVFKGFAGADDGTKKQQYKGVHRFEPGGADSSFDFNTLAGIATKAKPVTTKV